MEQQNDPYAGVTRLSVDSSRMSKALDMIAAFPPAAPVFFSVSSLELDGTWYLSIYATNRDYVYEDLLPVLNTDSIASIQTPIFLKFVTLYSLAKMHTDFVFVYEKGHLFFRNQYVNYQFRPMSVEGITLPSPDYSNLPWKDFPLTRNVLVSVRKMLEFGVKLVDNKVQWQEDRLKGFFITSGFDIKLMGEAPSPVQFRKYDVSLMSNFNFTDSLSCAIAGDRFYLNNGSGGLSFLYLPGSSQPAAEVIKKQKYGEVRFVLELLNKAIAFTKLDAAASTMFFTKTKEGELRVRLDASSYMTVGTGTFTTYGFSLRVEELKKLISVFPDSAKTVDCSIFEDGARFDMEDAEAQYVFSLGRFDTTQTVQPTGDIIDNLAHKGGSR
jgi:hypothetical protein